MWQCAHCSAYVVQLRNTLWVQTILRKMTCPLRPRNLWSTPVPESSDQSPGFHHRKQSIPQKRPRPQLPLQPQKRAKSSSGAVVSSVPCQAQAKPGDSASGSSAAAVSSVQRGAPWPCPQCQRMPWKCLCHRAENRTPEHTQQEFELMCKQAGVWEAAQAQQGEADQKAAQPEPLEEHLPGDLWSCWKCWSMNTRHDLQCCVASCRERCPLTQPWWGDQGDWI